MLLVFSSSFLVTNFSFLTAAKPSRSLRANFLFGTVWWLFLIFFLFCQWVLRERQWSHLSPKNCPKSYEITPPMTAAGPIRSQPCSSFSLSFQTTRRRRSPGAAGAAPVAGCSEMEGRVEKWVREWECNKIRRRRSDRHIGTEVWRKEGGRAAATAGQKTVKVKPTHPAVMLQGEAKTICSVLVGPRRVWALSLLRENLSETN